VLKRLIEEQVPEDRVRHIALELIAPLDPARRLDSEEAMAKAWADLAQSSPSLDVYEKSLAVSLRETGCDANGAPYVIRRLLGKLDTRFTSGSPQPAALATAFLDDAQCPGARGLSEEEKVMLREIRDGRPPAPPGPAPSTAKQ
jgi:hypothetical protein